MLIVSRHTQIEGAENEETVTVNSRGRKLTAEAAECRRSGAFSSALTPTVTHDDLAD